MAAVWFAWFALGQQAHAAEVIEYPSLTPVEDVISQRLVVYSTADHESVEKLLRDFQSLNPSLSISYHELQSLELYKRIKQETRAGGTTADITISSAMDLQMKLANDGYARKVSLSLNDGFPTWSNWRDEAFGITVEPSVMLYNKVYFADKELPKTRAALASFLRQSNEGLKGKIATYDIATSGLGFLFFSQDIQQYSAMWELVHAMGQQDVVLMGSSSKMIERVASGDLKLAYNVLGSYAVPYLSEGSDLGMILPDDYTVVFSRLGVIPKAATSPQNGQILLEYLLSKRGQKMMADTAYFSTLHPEVKGPFSQQGRFDTATKNVRPIKVTPSLLVYLDQVKRGKILDRWQRVISRP